MLGYFPWTYLLLVAHSFPRATLSENCSLLGTDNVRTRTNIRAYFRAKKRLLLIYYNSKWRLLCLSSFTFFSQHAPAVLILEKYHSDISRSGHIQSRDAFRPIARYHECHSLILSQSRGGALGEQGWRSGESTRLPPMCPGFDSQTRLHMWIEFVVGSRPCSEGFSPGSPIFFPPQKPTLLNSDPIGNSRSTGLSVEELLCVTLVKVPISSKFLFSFLILYLTQ